MPVLKNSKHEIFAQKVAGGCEKQEAAVIAGYSKASASQSASYLCKKPEVLARIAEISTRITEKSEWDATKVLIRLGDQAEADLLDLHNEDGSFKPVKDWPLVWRQMIQGLEIEEKSVRSTDGVQAGESKAWDKTGDRIIKIKFIDRLKNLELLGKHKAVDAFVSQKIEQHNHLHLSAEVTSRLQNALQRTQQLLPENAEG